MSSVSSLVSMRRLALVVAAGLVAGACGAPEGATTTVSTPQVTSTTTTVATTVVTFPPECPPVPYRVGVLPSRVAQAPVEPSAVALDEFTSIPGTSSLIWVDAGGDPAVELVRGTLPPREYPGSKGEVEVAGVRGVAGQFEDGTWVVAWFEEPGDRCDLYTMVFYQPVTPDEVRATVASISRRG